MSDKSWMSSDLPGNRKRALILGASGYLGGHIAQILLDQGWEVYGWGTRDLQNHPLNCSPYFHYQFGEVLKNDVRQVMLACEPDAVVFCIALDQQSSQEDISAALRVNVDSAWHLAVELDAITTKPSTFIYLSTIQVYGELSGTVDENYHLNPVNVYGLTHLMTEFAVRSFSSSKFVNPVVVRIANGYGPPIYSRTSCWSLVVNDFCRTAIREKKIQLLSAGTADRDFVFARDIAQSVASLAQSESKYDVFNIASGRTFNLLELAFLVADQYQKRYDDKIPVVSIDGGEVCREKIMLDDPSFVFDTRRLQMLDIDSSITIEEGIQALFQCLETCRI